MIENNKFTEPAKLSATHKPINTWKHMVAHVCIWFLVIALVMVYFTSTGAPQAGLLEVGAFALVFVVLFHLVMMYFPLVSKIITSVIVVGFGISLIFVNYHYLKVVQPDASARQLLVGDLLVHKILKTIKREPIATVAKEEIPQTVLALKQEKPSSIATLGQLKATPQDAIKTETSLESLQGMSSAPMIVTKTPLIAKKDNHELRTGIMGEEVAHVTFTKKLRETLVQRVTKAKDLMPLNVSRVIHETSLVSWEGRKLKPATMVMFESIDMKQLIAPLKEGRMPVH
ncbi:MAG TPA: hypothetical protein VJ440_05260 [Candidatus Brocadiaceae bacterium]|nr:hypothetical protein [Candidatus Brocadiaceae bacterium]